MESELNFKRGDIFKINNLFKYNRICISLIFASLRLNVSNIYHKILIILKLFFLSFFLSGSCN